MSGPAKVCPVCGKTFIGRNGQKYCSVKCRDVQYRRPIGLRTCPNCDRTFSPCNYQQIYCTPDCKREAQEIVIEKVDLHKRKPKAPGYEVTDKDYYDAHRLGPSLYALNGACPYANGFLDSSAQFCPVI